MNPPVDWPIRELVVALGIGLLIGTDRERRKGSGPERGAAGLRTFALVALLGALVATLGSTTLIAVFAAAVTLLACASYLHTRQADPGLTTEVALIVVFALGVLAASRPTLAAGLGVLVALLLASRSRLHEFVSQRLSDREIMDGMLLLAAALIVLPLLPNRAVDPFGILNPQVIWRLTVVVLLLNAFGYVAQRSLGANAGLAVAGFFGGFVSSAATIGTYGARSRAHPELHRPAVAGAALSSVATALELAVILAIANYQLLQRLSLALTAMGLTAAVFGGFYAYLNGRTPTSQGPTGRAFERSPPTASRRSRWRHSQGAGSTHVR